MPTPTVPAGFAQMNATLYTGTGSTRSVTNTQNTYSFQPDLIWLKRRDGVGDNGLYDSIRGISLRLVSNNTGAEASVPLDSFNANGFSTTSNYNNSGETLVAWQWKAGGAAVTNTAGSISAQVSANTTAGFSIVTYTGTGANATVGHGLGVAPKMIIWKNRNATASWVVWHTNFSAIEYIYLNLTNAVSSSSGSTVMNSTLPTSSVFSLGTYGDVNGSGNGIVAYCFAQIAGYSAFGSYTGNGSTDGPFVYTGFRPRFVIIKSSTFAGADWVMYDSARNTYNALTSELSPNSSAAENNYGGVARMDFVSNGIKMRTAGAGLNNSGSTYIYMVFAENPFKYALAR